MENKNVCSLKNETEKCRRKDNFFLKEWLLLLTFSELDLFNILVVTCKPQIYEDFS